MSNENKNTEKPCTIDSVSKRYASVIADIYNEHHVSAYDDMIKHNKGIIKAIAEFAIFYKENESNVL